MSTMREYIAKLSTDQMEEIIKNHGEWEMTGFIGEVPIRQHARAFAVSAGFNPDQYITSWMQTLAFECCRDLALRYLELRH